MIDIENSVFTSLAEVLRKAFPGISVSSAYVNAPKSFPHVSVVEEDNYPTRERLDTSDRERYVTLMYEINVYSDKASGKKAQCRDIMSAIDELMYQRNFIRLSMTPVPNMENLNIYRLVARYRAETDGENLYRR